MPQRPKAIALTSRSAIRTVRVSPCEGIRGAIPARIAEGRHRHSTLAGEGIALHHCLGLVPTRPKRSTWREVPIQELRCQATAYYPRLHTAIGAGDVEDTCNLLGRALLLDIYWWQPLLTLY